MSMNDPQWGRRPNQGPPDLDELLRGFNRKLNDFFGRRGGGGDGPSGGGSVKRLGGGAGLLLGLIVVVWLASGFYIVNEGQR
ncbi:MAG: protease modulator HflK N-terminal domain-containing protein, partial [Betaproteobacteria bacterium]|nr:protease modulator HflK N-terminal domain-containing protein [Betaproteobacteria bacterium]